MDYIDYHVKSSEIRDIDPANDALVYICDRFELNIEQRYWLAFLYGTCYCAATVFYIYNEFPDYENVDVNRLSKWWETNKHRLLFQTDRLKIKTMNKFIETFISYRKFIGEGTQAARFALLRSDVDSECLNYWNAYDAAMNIRNFGRFTMFLYLEMINLLTDFKCEPITIDWKHADNCRMGLCYAYGIEITKDEDTLTGLLFRLKKEIRESGCEHTSLFAIETTLCAYYKYIHGKRYIGYYLNRQREEIDKMKANVPTGVNWRVMDEFRNETYNNIDANLFNYRDSRNGENLDHEELNRLISSYGAENDWLISLLNKRTDCAVR